jgi:hypothetical protein
VQHCNVAALEDAFSCFKDPPLALLDSCACLCITMRDRANPMVATTDDDAQLYHVLRSTTQYGVCMEERDYAVLDISSAYGVLVLVPAAIADETH